MNILVYLFWDNLSLYCSYLTSCGILSQNVYALKCFIDIAKMASKMVTAVNNTYVFIYLTQAYKSKGRNYLNLFLIPLITIVVMHIFTSLLAFCIYFK